MSLQTDKRDLGIKIGRYMTLLSNLSNPPIEYIDDLDYMRGLVQIADQAEYNALRQTWDAMKPKDARSSQYIETGEIKGQPGIEIKSLIDLTWQINAKKEAIE